MKTLALILLSAPAGAQTFSLPQGCEAYATAQLRSCEVQHFFTCDNDAEGLQRSVAFKEEGMTYSGIIDAETQWVQSWHLTAGINEQLMDGAADPASLTELLETGVDTYDFRTDSAETGMTRFIGQDRLTGRTVTISGVTLDETEYTMRVLSAEGAEMWRTAGNEFVSRDWRRFLPGTGVTQADDTSFEADDTPVEFIFPGQPGFLSVNPKHGCGAVMSKAPIRPQEKETLHDHL